VGCTVNPAVRKQRCFASGSRYFHDRKYREAAIKFQNAVQLALEPFLGLIRQMLLAAAPIIQVIAKRGKEGD